MGKRVPEADRAAEEDAFSRWGRKYLCYLSRAGVIAEIKRDYRRRERNKAKQNLRERKYDA